MIAFTLSQSDLVLAKTIGNSRNAIKVSNGVVSRRHSQTLDDAAIHILGAKAEIAVARVLNVDINRRFTSNGDGGVDMTFNGMTFDVKMRSTPNTDLIIMPDMSDFTAQVVILCWPGHDEDQVILVGLTDRERFRREARDDLLTNPPRLVMPWRQLTQLHAPERFR